MPIAPGVFAVSGDAVHRMLVWLSGRPMVEGYARQPGGVSALTFSTASAPPGLPHRNALLIQTRR
jgi:hypothetical protein